MRRARLDQEVQMKVLKSVFLFPFKCLAALFLTGVYYLGFAAILIAAIAAIGLAIGGAAQGGTHLLKKGHNALVAADR